MGKPSIAKGSVLRTDPASQPENNLSQTLNQSPMSCTWQAQDPEAQGQTANSQGGYLFSGNGSASQLKNNLSPTPIKSPNGCTRQASEPKDQVQTLPHTPFLSFTPSPPPPSSSPSLPSRPNSFPFPLLSLSLSPPLPLFLFLFIVPSRRGQNTAIQELYLKGCGFSVPSTNPT